MSTTLIEKLEGLKEGIYYVDGRPNLAPFSEQVNSVVDKAIAIVRQHEAEQPREVMRDDRATVIEAALQLIEGGADLAEQVGTIRFALNDERLLGTQTHVIGVRMADARKSSFHITLSLAQKASRHALDEIERHAGCKFVPEIKGALAKHLTGILAHTELQGGSLTHFGIEKQLKNQVVGSLVKRTMRRRWRLPKQATDSEEKAHG